LLLLGLTPQRHLKLARLSRTYSRHLLTLERTEPCATTSPNDGRVRRSVSKKTALRENFFVLAARSLHLFCEPIDPNMMLFMFDRQGPADVFLSKNASQKNREHSYDLFMCHRGNDKSTVRVWSNSRHPHVSVVEFAERNGTGLRGNELHNAVPVQCTKRKATCLAAGTKARSCHFKVAHLSQRRTDARTRS